MSGRRRHPAVSASLRRGRISDLGALGCGVRAAGLAGATATLCSPLHAAMSAAADNAVLAVVGDLAPARAFELAKTYFAWLPKKELPRKSIRRSPAVSRPP